MIIDTHAHLDFPDFKDDIDVVIKRAEEVGVEYIINVGTSVGTSVKSLELAKNYDHIYASVGIHPNAASNVSTDDWLRLEALAVEDKVVAIGETGLDYYRDRSKKEDQQRLFLKHIELAERHHLPVIIHNREASEDCLEIVRQYSGRVNGVIHCFAGSKDDAKEFLEHGFYISFAGPITFPKAENLREALKAVPVEKLLLETDCPFLAPQPKRGKRNEPSYLQCTIPVLAELYKLSEEDIKRITSLNAMTLFGIGHSEAEPEIAYVIRNSLYLNITSRCPNKCIFCSRETAPYVKGHYLGTDNEPTVDALKDAIGDPSGYEEVVFCGFGESTERLDVLKEIAGYLKEKGSKVRLDTNGLGDLINGRSICEELNGLIDTICISLNTNIEEEYQKLCHSEYDGQAYPALISFIKKARDHIPDVMVSIVGMPGIDVEACRKIAEDLGVRFRVREYNNVG
ncbi:deoxyribonuclease [Candidatus Scalindua japonica]|uniref:Deoxyribonuclease n=1 Tax=Candidatus Scalindua japonica TaxID=1284222 RepID=A0A286TVF4_9BACT|nr:TatD family hydrolase [Candidatus Scalindua japonica]GAX59849.1 deoxyribonuclease [Candidatus Scalindua japonica]